jgi:hypothetical protein
LLNFGKRTTQAKEQFFNDENSGPLRLIVGIALLIALPYPFLAQHLRRKDNHDS